MGGHSWASNRYTYCSNIQTLKEEKEEEDGGGQEGKEMEAKKEDTEVLIDTA